jgi:tetratricopeptide (TPR) repeat protein
LVTAQDNPARDAYTFLLFSALTPAHIERTKERFAEKALLALARMSKESPEYAALRARAYMVIGYRPAAIKALGTPRTDEENELLAVLNGNLPEVRALAAREKNRFKRLLEKLDENNIARSYGVADTAQSLGEVKALNLPGQIWPFLAARAVAEEDPWSQFDNSALKLLLDREFPLKEYSLEQIARGAIAVSDARATVVHLSVFNHSRKYVEARAGQMCCQSSPSRLDQLDYLELLTAAGHDNLVRRLRFLSEIQGTPEPALDFANSIESVYKGYPYYTVERAKVERRLAASSGGVEGQGLIRTAFDDAFNAMYWEQGQSFVSADAIFEISQMGPVAYGYFDNFYSADIPYHPLYVIWSDGGDPVAIKANGMAALKNATSQFYPVLQLAEYDHDEKLMTAVVQATEQRFIGNPARGEFLASREILRGNTGEAMAIWRENIKLSPTYEKSYLALGELLLESASVDEAARTFMSYPQFKRDSGANRVGIANDAYTMGSLFFRSGDFEFAKPLYRIAASQGTGAGGEMSAALRLKLLVGDVNGAMAEALEYGQRYNESHGFRDYLGMLHASGNSAQAWSGFNTLVRQLHEPHIWETAAVGHHMAGASEADVAKWARQGEFANAGVHRSYSTCYLARFATMDRIPSKELSEEIADMDHSSWKMEDRDGYVVRPSVDGRSQEVLGPVAADNPHGVLSMGIFDQAKKHPVKSDLAYFVEGYRAIKLGDFPAAKAAFDEAATLYDMSAARSIYMLPYYALAAAKSGDPAVVDKILGRISAKDRQFDYQLADAILKGVAGKVDEGVRALELARYRRPNTDDRPLLTEYTYGDICELLFSVTGSPKIGAIALDWAKKRQISEPWQSWSYALEATLTHDPQDRKRAIAMTYYLDRKSQHLAAFKKSEIDEAVRMYEHSNVFVKKKVIKTNDRAI